MMARAVDPATGPNRPRRRILLTVSGIVPPDVAEQVERGLRPRPDYLEMAQAMGADILDIAAARRRAGAVGRVLGWLGAGPLLAWVCFREHRRYDAIVTDGEQVGLPLALLWKTTRRRSCVHVMIAHIMSVPKKVPLYRMFRLGRNIDRIVVYSSWQRQFIHDQLGFPEERILLTPFMVDTRFFDPGSHHRPPERMICAAGLERRDYPTLIEAVRNLDVRVVIGAASPWSKQPDSTRGQVVPSNVEVRSLGFVELREVYARSLFVVVPLQDVDFQAGVTTILEAMAMRRAVVCSRTRGQTDVVLDGRTGIYVAPGDVAELRAAIRSLLDDPARARSLGDAGRSYVEHGCDVTQYARRMAGIVAAAARGTHFSEVDECTATG